MARFRMMFACAITIVGFLVSAGSDQETWDPQFPSGIRRLCRRLLRRVSQDG